MVELTRCMGYFKRENAVTRCLYQLYNGTIWTVVSKTKTEAQSTQNSKTKHPNLENEAP